MKGIILAGGSGTRLYPLTFAISKQLLPIYDKPMVYYPLSTLMLAGIRDILVISTIRDLPLLQQLLGDGSRFGISLSYQIQEHPNGLAEAFILGKQFIGKDSVCLILGDNLFFGTGLKEILHQASTIKQGASIFGYRVEDPERCGVVSFDKKTHKATHLEEKPKVAQSPWAVTGLYFYDNDVVAMAEGLKPSGRGELEITDINNLYLQQNRLEVMKLSRGFAWFDMGSHDSLHDASSFVRTIEQRQGVKIMCPEEIALELDYLTPDELLNHLCTFTKKPRNELSFFANGYYNYLMKRADEIADDRN